MTDADALRDLVRDLWDRYATLYGVPIDTTFMQHNPEWKLLYERSVALGAFRDD